MGANNFADATTVDIETDGGEYTQAGVSNSAFTMETGEPLPTGFSSSKSAWWKYTPFTSGSVTIHTGPTSGAGNLDTELAVYTGSAVNALTKIASNSDGYPDNRRSQLTFTATGGVTYRIQVCAYLGQTMSYGLSVTGPATAMQSPDGALAVTLPMPTVSMSGTAPTPGALAVTLPVPTVAFAGTAPIPGVLAVVLPVLSFAGAGVTPPPRTGYGLVLGSTATVSAPPPVDLSADPVDPAGTPAPVQHVIVPTVPTPVLTNGRPS